MESNKYILDRLDDGYGVFLLDGNEDIQKLISIENLPQMLKEGDVVQISEDEKGYKFEILDEETEARLKRTSELIEKLKRK